MNSETASKTSETASETAARHADRQLESCRIPARRVPDRRFERKTFESRTKEASKESSRWHLLMRGDLLKRQKVEHTRRGLSAYATAKGHVPALNGFDTSEGTNQNDSAMKSHKPINCDRMSSPRDVRNRVTTWQSLIKSSRHMGRGFYVEFGDCDDADTEDDWQECGIRAGSCTILGYSYEMRGAV